MTYIGFRIAPLIYGPIQIFFAFCLMYFYVGVAFLSALGVIFLMLILSYLATKKQKYYNEKVLGAKDERMKITQ
jgi:hypothetical protein